MPKVYCPCCGTETGTWEWGVSPGDYPWICPECKTFFQVKIDFEP